jgi:hypothetical protein
MLKPKAVNLYWRVAQIYLGTIPKTIPKQPSLPNFKPRFLENGWAILHAGPTKKMKVEISNRLVGRTERPKRMVPEERGVYRRRYKKDD